MRDFQHLVDTVGVAIDGLGVLVIVLGIGVAVVRLLRTSKTGLDLYRQFRQDLGRGILLGLEFLLAADIIRTVAITPTLESVSVLGLIVLIRTFLSMALEMELQGKWPWQREPANAAGDGRTDAGA